MLNYVEVQTEKQIKKIERIGIDQFAVTYENGESEIINSPFKIWPEQGVGDKWFWAIESSVCLYINK